MAGSFPEPFDILEEEEIWLHSRDKVNVGLRKLSIVTISPTILTGYREIRARGTADETNNITFGMDGINVFLEFFFPSFKKFVYIDIEITETRFTKPHFFARVLVCPYEFGRILIHEIDIKSVCLEAKVKEPTPGEE